MAIALNSVCKMNQYEEAGSLLLDYIQKKSPNWNGDSSKETISPTLNLVAQEYYAKKTLDSSLKPAQWFLRSCPDEAGVIQFLDLFEGLKMPAGVKDILMDDLLFCAKRAKTQQLAERVNALIKS